MIETPQERSQSELESRQPLWIIYLPLAAGFTIIILIVAVLVVPGSWLRLNKWELSIIGDTIVVLMALCPLAICNFLLIAVLAGGVIGMLWANNKTGKLFGRVQEITHQIAEKTDNLTEDINSRSIGISTRFAYLNSLINIFERPDDGTKLEGKNE